MINEYTFISFVCLYVDLFLRIFQSDERDLTNGVSVTLRDAT